ncbi:MAG: hypothetical protein HXY40_02165 [Chloroflexi bacterium]|nr:hypothetical protein [Chloroflexota bacterium]
MAGFDNDLSNFEAQINENLKLLSSKKSAARREAALWLGESGEPRVIETMVSAYQKERDPGVKAALEYGLGMFRALEQALDRGEEKRVLDLLKKVTNEGKRGSALPISPRALTGVLIGLVISLVVLAGLNLTTGGLSLGGGDTAAPTQVAQSADATPLLQIVDALDALLVNTRNNANTLQAQYQAAVDGAFGDNNCAAFYNALQPYTLSAADDSANPGLAALVQRLNSAQTRFAEARAALDQACLSSPPVLSADQANAALQTVAAIQSDLTTVELDLVEWRARAVPTPVPTQESATPENAAPEEDTAQAAILRQAALMTDLVDNMTDTRGPIVLLDQNWSEAQTGGDSGCRQVDPVIPEDYALPSEVASASSNLVQAQTAVNLGLQLLRDGWTLYRTSCANNRLTANASTGLLTASSAQGAFDSARTLLNAVRSGG